MNYTKKAVTGAGINLVMGLGAAAIAYITRIVLARNLGPTDYGLFSSVLTFVMFFLFFRDLGLGQALIKHIVEFKVNHGYNEIKTAIQSVVLTQLLSSILFSLLFLMLSNYLSIHYFKDPRASFLLWCFVIYTISSIFFIVLKGIFNGFQRIFLFSSIEFVKDLLILLLILLFFKLGYGLLSPALAYALISILLFLIYVRSAAKVSHFFKSKTISMKKIFKKIILFGLPLFAVEVSGTIIGYIDTLMLTYFKPLSEVGIYNVVLPSALILLFLGRAVTSIAFPMSAELWAKRDFKRLSAGLRLIYNYSFVFLIPIIFTLFVFSDYFITLFFGSEYVSGGIAFKILLIGMMLFIVAMVNNNITSAIGYPKLVARIIIIAAVVNTVLNLILIPYFSIVGAAASTTISYALILVVSFFHIKKYVTVKIPIIYWLKQALAAIVFIGVMIYIKNSFGGISMLILIYSVIAALLVYVLLIYLLGAVNFKEIKYYGRLLLNRK